MISKVSLLCMYAQPHDTAATNSPASSCTSVPLLRSWALSVERYPYIMAKLLSKSTVEAKRILKHIFTKPPRNPSRGSASEAIEPSDADEVPATTNGPRPAPEHIEHTANPSASTAVTLGQPPDVPESVSDELLPTPRQPRAEGFPWLNSVKLALKLFEKTLFQPQG